jgi:hypothetical protein
MATFTWSQFPREVVRTISGHTRQHYPSFVQRVNNPKIRIMDNDTSAALEAYFSTECMDIELVAPHNHRTLTAERAICTVKNHMIAMFIHLSL